MAAAAAATAAAGSPAMLAAAGPSATARIAREGGAGDQDKEDGADRSVKDTHVTDSNSELF
jgi:hypothetical protein